MKAQDLRLARIETRVDPSDISGYKERQALDFFFPLNSLSPDGKWSVYSTMGDDPSRWGVWIKNTDTGEARFIVPAGSMPRWSPRGNLIAYLKSRPLPGKSYKGRQLYGEHELWVTDLNGESKRKLTPRISCTESAWSPDGKSIAVHAWDSEKEIAVLLVVDVESGARTVLDKPPQKFCDTFFSWSPDSKMIAYCLSEKAEMEPDWHSVDSEVFVVNADGTGKTQLTDTSEIETFVKWLLDGKTLLILQMDPSSGPEFVYLVLAKAE